MMWDSWCGGAFGSSGNATFGTWGIVGLVINVLFFLLIVIGSILLIRWFARSFRQPVSVGAASSGSLEILKERYAKGEISQEQFKEMRKEVGG